MDVQLQELLDRIKNEGVKAAEDQAQRLRAEAQARSDEILASARKTAEKIVADARAEAARFEHNAREALRQAGRDLILSLKGRISALFEALVQKETRGAYTPQVLEEAVVGLVKAWASQQAADLRLLLPAAQLAGLEKTLQSRLAAEIKKGLQIAALPGLEAGFRVGLKDGSVYFDLSDLGIAQILAEFLTPKVAATIQAAVES